MLGTVGLRHSFSPWDLFLLSLFFDIFRHGSDTIYILLYVDDIVFTASSASLLIAALTTEFSMKDLGLLHRILGMSVTRTPSGLFLSQRLYKLEILNRAGMSDCKPCTTRVDTNAKTTPDADPVADATHFCSLAGAL